MYRYRERDRGCSSDSDEEGIIKINKVGRDTPPASTVMDMDSKPEVPVINKNAKRKVNNVWASVAQEQTINEDMCRVNMNHKLSDRLGFDRGCESYDFMRKADDTRPDIETDEEIDLDYGVSDIENEFEDSGSEKPVKKTSSKVQMVERLEDATKIARELARKLKEPKVELLERTIQILGRKKVFDLFHVTEDIEDSGGMLIINGTRRRTPGGVFFYQVRKDRHITKKQKDLIFSEDKARYLELKKSQRKLARKKNKKKINTKTDNVEMEEAEQLSFTTESHKEVSDIKAGGIAEEVKEEKLSEQTSDVELEEGEIE